MTADTSDAADTDNPNSANARSVRLSRKEFSTYEATNARGGTIIIGGGGDSDFTPVELLLAAIAGCASVDVDHITSRRAEPDSFEVTSSGVKQNEGGNRLSDLHVTFAITFPDGPDGDAARERLPQAIRRSAESLCTVSRTVQLGTPVRMDAAG